MELLHKEINEKVKNGRWNCKIKKEAKIQSGLIVVFIESSIIIIMFKINFLLSPDFEPS